MKGNSDGVKAVGGGTSSWREMCQLLCFGSLHGITNYC